jgi:hypothetical protein
MFYVRETLIEYPTINMFNEHVKSKSDARVREQPGAIAFPK